MGNHSAGCRFILLCMITGYEVEAHPPVFLPNSDTEIVQAADFFITDYYKDQPARLADVLSGERQIVSGRNYFEVVTVELSGANWPIYWTLEQVYVFMSLTQEYSLEDAHEPERNFMVSTTVDEVKNDVDLAHSYLENNLLAPASGGGEPCSETIAETVGVDEQKVVVDNVQMDQDGAFSTDYIDVTLRTVYVKTTDASGNCALYHSVAVSKDVYGTRRSTLLYSGPVNAYELMAEGYNIKNGDFAHNKADAELDVGAAKIWLPLIACGVIGSILAMLVVFHRHHRRGGDGRGLRRPLRRDSTDGLDLELREHFNDNDGL